MNEYKIQLGINFNDSELKNVKKQLTNLTDNTHRIRIDIDNSRLLKQVAHAKKELKSLNDLGGSKGAAPALNINTKSVEGALNRVADSIDEIRMSLNTLDGKSGMQSLVASVNQIASALGKATDESETLIKTLSALGKKDFSVNLGLNVGGSNNPIARNAAYGNKVRSETLPQLKQQAEALVKYVNDYYKTSYNELEALQKLVHGTKLGTGDFYQNFLFGEDSVASRMSGGSLAGQMQAFKQFIDMFKQAASLKGLKLDPVTSQFSKSADELIKDAQDIQSGAKEAQEGVERLKGIFGASIDADALTAQLTPIVEKLEEIRVALNNLSNTDSLGGLTASFDKLSGTLETLLANAKQVQDVIDNGNYSTDAQRAVDVVVQGEEKKQQAIKETRRLISDSAQSAINAVTSKSIDRAFEVDEDKSLAFKREMENLVSQWTDSKGKLTDIKINTETFYDSETGRNIERISRAQVTYNNELGETIKKTIALRQIDSESSMVDGKEKVSPVYGFVEVAGQYSKSLGKTKTQTDAFVKQQKQSVANLTNQINQMNRAATDQNAARPIKLESNLTSLSNKYNEITAAIQRMENASSDTFVDEQNNVKKLISEYKSLVSEYRNAENVSTKMKGTDFASGLEIAKNNLGKFKAEARDFPQIAKTINDLDTAISGIGDASSLNKFNDQLRVAKSELARIKSETSEAKQIKIDLKTGEFNTQISNIEQGAKKLSGTYKEIDGGIEKLNQALSNMKTAAAQGDVDGLIKSYKQYEATLKAVENQIDQNRMAEKSASDLTKLNQKKQSLALEMKNWLKDNSAAAQDFGARIRELQMQIDACDDSSLGNLRREFQNIKKEAQLAGKTTKTVGDRIKEQFAQYSTYLGVAEIFMWAEQGLRDMFEQVKLIDSAMTELKKVTNETDSAYNQFLSNAASRAKEIGTTIDGLVSSTADFARLGYDFKDAQGLAEVANIYAVVGDDIDSVETATQSLISTLTAFKDEAGDLSESDFALSIVDKMNEVANNFAISSGGLGEALQRSASSMMAANNSLDETIALITAANTVVQDPDSVGKELCRL